MSVMTVLYHSSLVKTTLTRCSVVLINMLFDWTPSQLLLFVVVIVVVVIVITSPEVGNDREWFVCFCYLPKQYQLSPTFIIVPPESFFLCYVW